MLVFTLSQIGAWVVILGLCCWRQRRRRAATAAAVEAVTVSKAHPAAGRAAAYADSTAVATGDLATATVPIEGDISSGAPAPARPGASLPPEP